MNNEAGFTRNGVVDFRNKHDWAHVKSHALMEFVHQTRFFSNPVILSNILLDAAYLNLLHNTMSDTLNDFPLDQRHQT